MPVKRYDHLQIPFLSEYERKKRKKVVIRYKKEGQADHDKSYSVAKIEELTILQEEHLKVKKKYKEYLDPNLIFKIYIDDKNIATKFFTTELERMKIEVLSESPNKSGYWIVFSTDEELNEFKRKLKIHGERESSYQFFYAIRELSDIPPEEKIGLGLNENPLGSDEKAYLDVEIWRMEDYILNDFLKGFNSLIENLGGKIVDNLIRHNFCLLRIHMDLKIMDEIIELKEIALIDRPPYHRIVEELLETDIEDLEIKGSPPENNSGILIVDSGIRSGHPLLSNAVADEISIATRRSTKILNDDPTDDVGHGTMVSGIALYGDISKCIVEKNFEPKIWIFSSKVMFKDEYGRTSYDPEELLEHQLEKAVKTFVSQYPNCKIVNISFGNDIRCFKKGMRQFNLAALIDELSKELNVIFVVSTGNSDVGLFEDYLLNFLNNENEDVKLIDPATSALSLTVGASCLLKGKLFNREAISPTTRVGPGIRGMIKPELIENGGYGYGEESDIIVLNPNWIEEGRLFTQNCGTSFSAPKVSHILALLINKYRTTSLNLIKAILISSTSISNDIIKPIEEIDTEDILDILDPIMITGYGTPNLDRSLFSYDNHVLLIRENKIKLNNIHIYPIFIPKSFITEKGERSISVSLAFDPPVNKNRADYLGCTLEAKLYRNIPPEEIQNYYQTVNIEEEEDDEDDPKKKFEKLLRKNQIDIKPNLTTRKLGVHQKGEITFRRSPKIDTNIPLTLVIINRNRWISSEDYNQDYGVVLTLEHKAMINLYDEIRILIRERARAQT